ncbi:MAG: cytochrome C oxidase subunit II [Candidatus Lambdaproteobacteria bacterium]|nr:cytochrome C oxidase subunit II [Candidatus Lambdaproteobacteria bacterium]
MADDMIVHGPNVIHPETASAVGSRNSLNRHERDEYSEARTMIDEEVDKVLNHIHAKLPPEALSRLEVMGSIKSKLHAYYNQTFQNMLNRYLTTAEDELGKKVRDMVDGEEMRGLNRYAPRPISYLLDRVGGADKFNTSEVEKSIVNMFGHLHGHVQREVNDLETLTNSLLRRKTDVGAFVRGENAYAIVKCSFRDLPDKPTTVQEIKLALNILDSELISAIYQHQTPVTFIIKQLITSRVMEAVDVEVKKINESLVDEGKPELTAEEQNFERIKAVENHTSDEETDGSRRFTYMAKKIFDAIEGLQAEIKGSEYDALGVRENVYKVVENENIRNRGYNTAVNSMTHVLDWSRMGYQHIENYKSARRCIIREYAETNAEILPDERYQMELAYLDNAQIKAFRDACTMQLQELERTVHEVGDVVEAVFREHLEQTGKEDWIAFSKRLLAEKPARRGWFGNLASGEPEGEAESAEEPVRHWNEITFVTGKDVASSVAANPTYEQRMNDVKGRFPVMFARLEDVFGETNPDLRVILESRLRFLEIESARFSAQINPFHLNAGLLLEVDIVTIKRKSSTMMNMANVLNEFIYAVSKGFQDTAFASFSRRRSTERADMLGGFQTGGGLADVGAEGGAGQAEEVFQ